MTSPIDEALLVKKVWKAKLTEGEVWAVIDAKWWRMWCAYTGFSVNDDSVEALAQRLESVSLNGDKPGPINNSRLHEPGRDYELLRSITEGEDYVIVPEEAWDLLHTWYTGGPAFKRTVIALGLQRETRLDFYPTFLRFFRLNDQGQPDESTMVALAFPKKATFQDILDHWKKELKDKARTDGEWCRLWMKRVNPEVKSEEPDEKEKKEQKMPEKWQVVRKLTQTLEGIEPGTDVTIWVEVKTGADWARSTAKKDFRNFEVGDIVDAKDSVQKWYESEIRDINTEKKLVLVHYINWAPRWDRWIAMDSDEIAMQGTHTNGPYEPKQQATYDSYYSSSYSSYSSNEEGTPAQRGAVGLRNLGNTCFMNSTLQCLSNTPILTNYFLEGTYTAEINRDNPLGWHGRIADEYGALLQELWSGKYTVVAPSKFKKVLGEFAPRFSGFQQQDSSELLSFLLDGLHEDLNQVKKKPATQGVESKGRPDDVVAKEAWDTYLLRNRSVITNTLQGQLKSRLVCPKCSKVSITFDPFMFLSVPLPQVEDKIQTVTFVFADSTQPMLTLEPLVSKTAYIAELKTAISKLVGINTKRLVVTDVWTGKICRFFADDEMVTDIRRGDSIYVYEIPELEQLGPNHRLVQVIHFQYKQDMRFRADCFGLPLLVCLPKADVTCGQVRDAVNRAASAFVKPDLTNPTPYTIIQVDSSGRSCAICDWSLRCSGCKLPDAADAPFALPKHKLLALEWDDDAQGYRADKLTPAAHSSVGKGVGPTAEVALDISNCMGAFTREEVLGENDPWYCSDCKEHQRASKKFDLWKLPEILIVHLKRFSYSRIWREKITSFVDFPIDGLDMSQFCQNPAEASRPLYDLFAVSNHMGNMGGGHYNAYCKNLVDQKWYLHDDSSIRPVTNPDQIKSPSAYVLFYKRRGSPDQQ